MKLTQVILVNSLHIHILLQYSVFGLLVRKESYKGKRPVGYLSFPYHLAVSMKYHRSYRKALSPFNV
jgi:hypothetical protein